MKLLSADLDPKRAEVVITIDIENPGEDNAPLVLTYSTDSREDGETVTQYRTRLRDWLVGVRREARLMADLEVVAAPSIEDVKVEVEPAFI